MYQNRQTCAICTIQCAAFEDPRVIYLKSKSAFFIAGNSTKSFTSAGSSISQTTRYVLVLNVLNLAFCLFNKTCIS